MYEEISTENGLLGGMYQKESFKDGFKLAIQFMKEAENYDSIKNQASNDSSTFIIACNDYYSKQNSIEIRNVLNDKRKNGKFIGSMPSFGYMRDPEDKGHLIPDPEYAPIVKKIFGSKSARDVKRLRPLVEKINRLEESYQSLTDEQLS